jgi:hypothetical protein
MVVCHTTVRLVIIPVADRTGIGCDRDKGSRLFWEPLSLDHHLSCERRKADFRGRGIPGDVYDGKRAGHEART